MSNTYSVGDQPSDPGSRYGTCLREDNPECRLCDDTGITRLSGRVEAYCDCTIGHYLERAESEAGGPVDVTYRR